MTRVPVTVSFDALDTLLQITGGIGYQYLTAYTAFLREHGIDLAAGCPNATSERMSEVNLQAIRDQTRRDRALWTRTDNPKEMPLGGYTTETIRDFWTRVIEQALRDPALYEGGVPDTVQKIEALWQANNEEVRRFEEYVIFDLFASTKAYSWLPASLETLLQLREWNARQLARAAESSTSSSSASILCLAAPPFVVSNMDNLLMPIFRELGALASGKGETPAPPLLSRIIPACDAGLAKPSPVGILMGVREIAAAYHAALAAEGNADAPGVEVHHHVHVGDAEADRLACERAGCHYVECDPTTGVTWKQLHAKLQELEAACQR